MPNPIPKAAVRVEGLKDFQRAVRRGADKDLPKRLGRAHKFIGQHVIDHLEPRPDPAAVGAGAGASVRPSASKRDVLLRVGGKHRAGHSPEMQWGKRRTIGVGTHAPKRPYIKRTAEKNRDEIGELYLEAISAAFDGAFAETSP